MVRGRLVCPMVLGPVLAHSWGRRSQRRPTSEGNTASGGAVRPLPRDGPDPYCRYMTIGALAIRPLEERPEADALLAEWFAAEWSEYHRGRSLPDVASRFRLVPDVQQTLVAEIEGEIVGTVTLRGRWEAAPEIPPPWVGGLYVVPQRRGKGIGMALVDAAVAAATTEGHSVVHMSVRVDPVSYIRIGWEVVGTVFVGDENVTVLRTETCA